MICHVHAVCEAEAQQMREGPEAAMELLEGGLAGEGLSLQKSWHGLHFVLNGSAEGGREPLNFLLDGGLPVGEDMGYGPARLFSPKQVASLAKTLEAITPEEFDRRFDVEALAAEEVYPRIWDERREDLLAEYQGYFGELRKLVREAARGGRGLLVSLS
jgi:hypothetical protein